EGDRTRPVESRRAVGLPAEQDRYAQADDVDLPVALRQVRTDHLEAGLRRPAPPRYGPAERETDALDHDRDRPERQPWRGGQGGAKDPGDGGEGEPAEDPDGTILARVALQGVGDQQAPADPDRDVRPGEEAAVRGEGGRHGGDHQQPDEHGADDEA